MHAGNGAGLPPKILTHVFTIGPNFAGKMMACKNVLQVVVSWRYEIAPSPADACFGAQLPSTLTSYLPEKATKDVVQTVKVDAKRAMKKLMKQRTAKEGVTDPFATLSGPVGACLKVMGLPLKGMAESEGKCHICKKFPRRYGRPRERQRVLKRKIVYQMASWDSSDAKVSPR